MVFLSDLDLIRCPLCGALFQAAPGRQYCTQCTLAREDEDAAMLQPPANPQPAPRPAPRPTPGPTPGPAAQHLSGSEVSWRKIYEVLRQVPVPNSDTLCTRCASRPRLAETEFCLPCHVELQSALGDAKNDLFDKMEFLEDDFGKPDSVIAILEAKRARTATSRIKLSGAQRLKY